MDEQLMLEKYAEQYARKIYPQLYAPGIPVPKQTIERFMPVAEFCADKVRIALYELWL